MSRQTQREGCLQVLSTVPGGPAVCCRASTLSPAPKNTLQTAMGCADRGMPVLLKGTARGAGDTGQKQVRK